jgi:hypothetical protein
MSNHRTHFFFHYIFQQFQLHEGREGLGLCFMVNHKKGLMMQDETSSVA